jgi:hypothetical protein
MAQTPDEFFTWAALGTLAGASGATFVITNTLRSVLDWSPKWLGLVIAQIVCIGAAASLGKSGSDFVIAILNGCLVYLSAVGVASASGGTTASATARGGANEVSRRASATARGGAHEVSRRSFLSPWF